MVTRGLVKMARAATDDPDPDPDASALPSITREEARAMALDALGATGADDDERTAEALSAARMGAVALSDETRGAAYRLAVETHARDADLVLDVGGGVGLLGVVAARAGAKRVVTFAPSTANLASSVALANDVPPDRLHVLDASVADARPDGPDAWRVRAEAPVLGAVLDVAHPRANLVLAESLETNLLDPGPSPTSARRRDAPLARVRVRPRRRLRRATRAGRLRTPPRFHHSQTPRRRRRPRGPHLVPRDAPNVDRRRRGSRPRRRVRTLRGVSGRFREPPAAGHPGDARERADHPRRRTKERRDGGDRRG